MDYEKEEQVGYIYKYIYNHLFSSALYIIVRLGIIIKKVGRRKIKSGPEVSSIYQGKIYQLNEVFFPIVFPLRMITKHYVFLHVKVDCKSQQTFYLYSDFHNSISVFREVRNLLFNAYSWIRVFIISG